MEILILIAIFLVILIIWGNSGADKARHEMEAKIAIKSNIATHVKSLSVRRRQTAPFDAYGNRDVRRWHKEQDYFIETVLKIRDSSDYYRRQIGAWIDQTVDEFESAPEQQASPLMQPVESNMSPEEYEHHCAGLLRGLGWASRVTKATGDQGVDVVAEKGGHKVVIQCKKYSKPVGNKAVQEVLAAMKFEDADAAAVVTNNSFTPSARELASKSGVLLLHHSELDRLDELIDEAVDECESVTEQQTSSPIQPFDSSMPQEEYEQYCLGLMRSLGWTIRLTRASGDQGIEIIAEKRGQKFVIQCKKYSIPLEDKALQEVIAAIKFENANFAAVVTNITVSQSARALANKGGVLLLHHSELDLLDELFNWCEP